MVINLGRSTGADLGGFTGSYYRGKLGGLI